MAVSSSLPLAAAAAAVLVLAVSTVVVPAAGAGSKQYSGARTVIVRRGHGTRAAGTGARGSYGYEWRYGGRGRLLEDEVAPELMSGLFGAGQGGSLSYGALDQSKPACPNSGQCAGKGRGSYTRDCTYKEHCPHTST